MSMLDAARPQRTTLDLSRLLASRWLWCLAAILFLALRELATGFGDLLTSLGDTDDATRLHQVRTLIATGGWFDMTLPRIGGAQPLVSHWSRLIDVPLIILLQTLGLFLSPDAAELATRIIWPMLLLLVFLRLLVRAAEAQGGTSAGWLMLFMAATCMSGLFQFRIGRIDHHNAMILGAVAGLLILLEARKRPAAGTFAGVLVGLGLAVGFEPLAIVLPAFAAITLWALFDLTWLAGVRRMAVACAATLGGVFIVTVAPWDWLLVRCDALSLKIVVLIAGAAAGLTIVDKHGRLWTPAERFAALAGSGALGLAGYAALDTRCLAGPFGQVAPAIKPLWLDHVTETASIISFFQMNPTAIVASVLFMIVAIICAVERWRRVRTPESLALLGLIILITPAGLWMIKLTPYASWVAAFAITLSIADLGPTQQLTTLSRQLAAALMLNQWSFVALAKPLLMLTNVVVEGTQCMTTPAIRALSALPKGFFFVAPIDYGAYLVTLTPHDVLAAPYHRADRAIIENQAILAAQPAEARQRLAAISADYLLLCLPKPDTTTFVASGPRPNAPTGLEARLHAGQTVDFLEPVTINAPVAELKVWRILR
jgi:hypothetical protein